MTESTEKKITGAEALIRGLIAEDTDTMFGYPGGAIMPAYDALMNYEGRLRHILARHEQGAIHAAQGYARVSGKPGVVMVTSGPAATNLVTGLSDALMDSTPLVCITGQVAAPLLGYDAFQETDVVGVTLPVTKWTIQVSRAEDIATTLARAFFIASTGRPGPVLIDITRDALTGITDDRYERCHEIRSYKPQPTIDGESLLAAARLINSAERPLVLAGQGVILSGAEDALLSIAERADLPAAATMLGLSAIPDSHPLKVGMLGMHGNLAPNVNTNRADVIIAVGMRFDDRVTGNVNSYAPDAKIIHFDIDAAEFNKNITADVIVHADARRALEALLPLINAADHSRWRRSFADIAGDEDREVIDRALRATAPGEPMRMGRVIKRVTEASGPETITVTDVGQNQMMAARYAVKQRRRGFLTSGGLGTMGYAIPAAIGAKIAAPDAPVVMFAGDGGFQMTLQELGTIMQYRIGVKMVILNNNFLGNVRQWQQLFYNGRFSQTPMTNPDFVALAASYGIPAENVDDNTALDGAIRRMLDAEGPYLLNVNIDSTDMVFPMTCPGAAVDEIMLSQSVKYQVPDL